MRRLEFELTWWREQVLNQSQAAQAIQIKTERVRFSFEFFSDFFRSRPGQGKEPKDLKDMEDETTTWTLLVDLFLGGRSCQDLAKCGS